MSRHPFTNGRWWPVGFMAILFVLVAVMSSGVFGDEHGSDNETTPATHTHGEVQEADHHEDAHDATVHGDAHDHEQADAHGHTDDEHGHGHEDAHGAHVREIAPVLTPDTVPSTAWPPALFLVLGAVLIPFFPRALRSILSVALPAFTLWYIWTIPDGTSVVIPFAGYQLEVLHADRLSLIFGKIFALVGMIASIYAWHNGERKQQIAALLYNAGALGVTFAGDYFTLYAFWELMAVASTILIWARGKPESQRAGNRYLLVHLAGGAVLLGGILLNLGDTGSIAIARFLPGAAGMAPWLILIGFCLNAAVPPLGPWLPDAYPRATITGAIFCSALTTKTAVYALLRVFPGWEVLAIAGAIMALYGVVYAILSNDIRELLSYHIISQVGYMVAGCGIGTAMAVNGSTAHAVCHILYKALLFMGAGAIIQTTGREKLTELGGFWKRQKLIFGLYMIGAFSISGFPIWNGFTSKSMVVAAAGEEHITWAFMLLSLASVGTFLSIGLKLAYAAWMGEDRGIKPEKAPTNMIVAMSMAAFLCTLLGLKPGLLYQYLPYAVHWNPFTAGHIIEAVQMIVFTFFMFYLLIPKFVPHATISLDTDVFYRRPAPVMRAVFLNGIGWIFDSMHVLIHRIAARVGALFADPTEWIPGWPARVSSDDPGYDEDRARLPLALPLSLTLLVLGVVWVWFMLM
ncbi:Na(+)/H(+) antiporter subunit D [Candidatus Eisenbacteria bacterium]|uniref:Na(+)/H(+) antiporter subunit D n=1 Tax=Eiseniibacteriota bacterium TaxID=2212470 RepID=A0ABV6YJT3_UNCEI